MVLDRCLHRRRERIEVLRQLQLAMPLSIGENHARRLMPDEPFHIPHVRYLDNL
jgi:hypothetical protein